MRVKQLKSEGLKREYNITVPAENVDGVIKQRLTLVSKEIKMPGFRPGKVPLSVVKKTHGKKVLGEVLENLIQTSSADALAEESLRPAAQPKIEIITFEEGKDLEYKMELEIIPDIPELDFAKISIEKPVAEIDEGEIDDAIRRIADDHKHFNRIKGKRGAKMGDAVVMDFKGFVGDEAFEGGEAQNHQLELGSGQFIPGFEEQLIGMKEGDDRVVKVTFPKEYHSEKLAGKDAKFEVKLHEIKEAETHDKIDDEFAKHLGLESLAALKEAVRGQIEKEVEAASRRLAKKNLFDVIDDILDFEMPELMFKTEFDAIWKQMEEVRKQNPKAEEFKKPEKELKKEYEDMAGRRVRLGILLAEISRKEDIQVAAEELNGAIMAEARNYPGQEQAVIEYYQKNKEAVDALRGPVLEEKVTDFILGKVKTKEIKLSMEDLRSYEDGDSAPKKASKAKKSSSGKKTGDKKPATKNNTKKTVKK